MTQHCPYDEKLLDYLYEELGPEEAKDFSAHLQGCERCQAALEKLGGARRAFRELPQPAIEEDSLQRMTAQLLAQAQAPVAKQPATGKDKAGKQNVQTLGSTKDLPSAEVGKLLPFRRKGWKGVLFHPAAGVVAAAAMALVFVVAKNWQAGPILPTVVESPGALKPDPLSAAAPAARATAALEKDVASQEAQGAAPTTSPALGDDEVPSGGFGAKGEADRQDRRGGKLAAPLPSAPTSAGYAEESKAKKLDAPADSPKEAPARGRLRSKDLDDDLLGGVTADKVAPGPAQAPLRERAVAKDEAEQRPVPFEALKPQAAAGAAPPPSAAPAAPPPPPPVQAQAPSKAPPRAEPQLAPEIGEGQDVVRQQLSNIQRNDLNRATAGKRASTADGAGAAQEPGAAALLTQLREQVKHGQCREAVETLARLDRSFPDFTVPAEDRAQTRTCLLRQNSNQGSLDNQGNQFDESAGDFAAKTRAAKPAPAAQEYRRPAKRSAPSKKGSVPAF